VLLEQAQDTPYRVARSGTEGLGGMRLLNSLRIQVKLKIHGETYFETLAARNTANIPAKPKPTKP